MKTAISIPDETFERAEREARRLGVSRSEFFTKAAERWLAARVDERLTEQIDAAVAQAPDSQDDVDFLTRAAQQLAAHDTP